MNLTPLSLFLSILFFISGCHQTERLTVSYNLTSKERVWMEKFFKDIMLDHCAVYTLCGSKPMTKIDIYYHSEEEVMAWYDQMSDEEKKTAVVVDDYDLPENWEKWEKICSHFPMSRYLFFRRVDPEDPNFASLYFVDIAKTASTLQENYAIFRSETGFKFDPLKVVLAIKEWPEFWNKVFDSSTLVGLLYGFGLKNSSSFAWKYGDHPEAHDRFFPSLNPKIASLAGQEMQDFDSKSAQMKGKHSQKVRAPRFGANYGSKTHVSWTDPTAIFRLKSYFSDEPAFGKATLSKFPLPIFASYSDGKDEVIEKYRKEREAIRKEYRGKDFLNSTLEKLTSQ